MLILENNPRVTLTSAVTKAQLYHQDPTVDSAYISTGSIFSLYSVAPSNFKLTPSAHPAQQKKARVFVLRVTLT